MVPKVPLNSFKHFRAFDPIAAKDVAALSSYQDSLILLEMSRRTTFRNLHTCACGTQHDFKSHNLQHLLLLCSSSFPLSRRISKIEEISFLLLLSHSVRGAHCSHATGRCQDVLLATAGCCHGLQAAAPRLVSTTPALSESDSIPHHGAIYTALYSEHAIVSNSFSSSGSGGRRNCTNSRTWLHLHTRKRLLRVFLY